MQTQDKTRVTAVRLLQSLQLTLNQGRCTTNNAHGILRWTLALLELFQNPSNCRTMDQCQNIPVHIRIAISECMLFQGVSLHFVRRFCTVVACNGVHIKYNLCDLEHSGCNKYPANCSV